MMIKLCTNAFMILSCFTLLTSLTAVVVDGFAAGITTSTTTATAAAATNSQLMMSSSTANTSRRDILKNSGVTIAAATVGIVAGFNPNLVAPPAQAAPITAQSAANKAAESFQGVYFDPKHPEGYRILIAKNSKNGGGGDATMTLSDGVPKDSDAKEKTYRKIPVKVNGENGKKELTIDFSFKGGPKNIVATLSGDKNSLVFADGNTWTKNREKYDGIYKTNDPKNPNGIRIVRKGIGSRFIVEVYNSGNTDSAPTTVVNGRMNGSTYAIPTVDMQFNFPDSTDPDGVTGKLCLLERNTVWSYGTITFPDGTVWTRI